MYDTPEEAVWKALLELEPKLAQMEEPDIPALTTKFLDELRLSGFAVVKVAELEKLKGTQPMGDPSKIDVKKEKTQKRLRRPVDSEANS